MPLSDGARPYWRKAYLVDEANRIIRPAEFQSTPSIMGLPCTESSEIRAAFRADFGRKATL